MTDAGSDTPTPDVLHPASGLNRPLDSWDIAKLIAIGLMFIDHVGAFVYLNEQWLRAIGRGAAPIFLFLAGFAASYRFKWEIFALGILLTISDTLLVGHPSTQNILFTILICRAIFAWMEKRGRIIARPYEWYVGSLTLFMSLVIVQYGSLGFLFALSGYLQRHSAHYPPQLPRRFLILTCVTYGCFTAPFSEFSLASSLLMAFVLYGVYWLLSWLKTGEIHADGWPRQLTRAMKLLSYYSGYIYALHLIALEWITKVPL